jgi:hypothetical protein
MARPKRVPEFFVIWGQTHMSTIIIQIFQLLLWPDPKGCQFFCSYGQTHMSTIIIQIFQLLLWPDPKGCQNFLFIWSDSHEYHNYANTSVIIMARPKRVPVFFCSYGQTHMSTIIIQIFQLLLWPDPKGCQNFLFIWSDSHEYHNYTNISVIVMARPKRVPEFFVHMVRLT